MIRARMDMAERKHDVDGGLVLHRMMAQRALLRGPQDQAAVAASAAVEVDLGRAAATALGRAAERLHRLPVFVEKAEFAAMSLPELAELLPERALLAVVEGGRDLLGVVGLCPALLASLIEMQALGRVTARAPTLRRATRTDAAISADFVNAFLAELGRELGHRPDYPTFDAFRYTTFLDDPRPLALMLEDGEMLRLTLRFRIGPGGQRDGTLMLALPIARPARQTGAPGRMLSAPQTAAPTPEPPRADLREAVQQAPVRLVGVLCRRRLSLRMLRELAPGATIPLGPNVLDEARIETPQGQVIAHGRLGEAEGFHAIRLGRAAGAAPHPSQDDGIADAMTADLQAPLGDLHQPDAFRLASATDAAQKVS